MIVDAIINVVLYPLGWLLDALPSWTWPDWMDTGVASAGGDGSGTLPTMAYWLGERVGWLRGWVHMEMLFSVGGVVLLFAIVVAGVRGVRFVVSLVSGGGGAT